MKNLNLSDSDKSYLAETRPCALESLIEEGISVIPYIFQEIEKCRREFTEDDFPTADYTKVKSIFNNILDADKFQETYAKLSEVNSDDTPCIVFYPISKAAELHPTKDWAEDQMNACREPIPYSFIDLEHLKDLEIKMYLIDESVDEFI